MKRIHCNREILSALKSIKFPKTKKQILMIAQTKSDICEASIIMMNKLEDKIYCSLDEICDNIKIVCSLELINVLKKMKFPITKNDIIKYLREKNYSNSVIDAVEDLSEEVVYKSISDICI